MLYNFLWLLWKRLWSRLKIRNKTDKKKSMINNLMNKTNRKRRITSSRKLRTTRCKCKIWPTWLEKKMKVSILMGKSKDNVIQFKESVTSSSHKSNNMNRMNRKNSSSIITSMMAITNKLSKMSFHKAKKTK